jgi:hypothetical protein
MTEREEFTQPIQVGSNIIIRNNRDSLYWGVNGTVLLINDNTATVAIRDNPDEILSFPISYLELDRFSF